MSGDYHVFPKDHIMYDRIVYDSDAREYYDNYTDMFLTEDDIKFYGLKPYEQIPTPLPEKITIEFWDAAPEE